MKKKEALLLKSSITAGIALFLVLATVAIVKDKKNQYLIYPVIFLSIVLIIAMLSTIGRKKNEKIEEKEKLSTSCSEQLNNETMSVKKTNDLLQTIKDGDIKKLESLLTNHEIGIDDKFGYYESTILYYAAECNKDNIVELLLKHGANPNIEGWDGSLPLQAASENGNLKMVELLLEYKADVNAEGLEGVTSLHAAIDNGNIEIVKLLIKEGANVNHFSYLSNCDGTPLHFAACRRKVEIVELLLDSGADINAGPVVLRRLIACRSVIGAFLFLASGTDFDIDNPQLLNRLPLIDTENGYIKIKDMIAEFETIKAKPHLDKLIEAYKNRDTIPISNCVKNRTELIQEVQEIKKCCNPAIFKCLCDFVERIIQSSLLKRKKILFKKYTFNAFLSKVTNIKGFYLADANCYLTDTDAHNLPLICKDINLGSNEYKDVYSNIEIKANQLLTQLKSITCVDELASKSR